MRRADPMTAGLDEAFRGDAASVRLQKGMTMPYDLRKLSLVIGLATLLLVFVLLYWTRVVLIPVALAILLTFVLDPVVSLLQRSGLPRTPAVVLVVVIAFFILGGIGWIVTWRFTTPPNELPQY